MDSEEEFYESINAVCKQDAKMYNQQIILDPAICRFPLLTSRAYFLVLKRGLLFNE